MTDQQPLRSRGIAWVVGQTLLMIGCFGLGWLNEGKWPGSWATFASGSLLVIGAAFGVSGVWVLGQNRTIFPEPRAGSVLIEHGIYALVRHPLYTSVMMLSVAWGCWRQSLPALGCALILIGFLCAKARSEEQRLLRRFPRYKGYMKSSKRFIPWLV